MDYHALAVGLTGVGIICLWPLAVIRYFEGPWLIRRCAWHPGGKVTMWGFPFTFPMPFGRLISLAIERRPLRWFFSSTDGLCSFCAARANDILDREMVK